LKSKLYRAFVYLLFILLLLYVFAPYLWLFTAAFSPAPNLEVEIPKNPTLMNFIRVFTGRTLRWILNSLIISFSVTLLSILATTPGGYALSRGTFKGKSTLMYGIILSRVIPGTLIVVPLYSMLFLFRLLDTHLGLIMVYVGGTIPLNLWIMKGAIDSIPRELEEAAEIDGASRMKILTYVIFPLIRPGLGAVSIMSFMAAWSGFLLPLILLNSDKKYPISVGLFTAFGIYGEVDYSLLATLCLVYMAPIIIIYLAVRSSFASGLASIGTIGK
jgi:multiple sugar transport system permease protein